MKSVVRATLTFLLLGPLVFSVPADFTSLYVFGDGVCTTTNNPLAGPYYHGLRRTNGRVWVEVLAERQGLTYEADKNWSYYGHYSAELVANVNSFAAPPDAGTALFVVWVNDADFVDDMGRIYPSLDLLAWTSALTQSLSNHFTAITNLYARGARTLILPNAADITRIPQYNFIESAADRSFIRQRVIEFNTAFGTALPDLLRTNCPGITIYLPDVFTLLDNVLAHPAEFGLTNALYDGRSIDALEDPLLADKSLDGPGADYIFWDATDPSARFHAVMADYVQQLISPARFGRIASASGGSQLVVTNIPRGLNGFVAGSADLVNWTDRASVEGTNGVQTIFVPVSGPREFYRLRFPLTWSWP